MSAQRPAYTSDLPDEAWEILQPWLPPAKPGGRPRQYALRDGIAGIPYGRRGGYAWRVMPHDLPHGQTADQPLRAWCQDGTWQRL